MRLNWWILAWVQHALLTPGVPLWDANIFHPAAAMLTGSEAMFGVTVPLLPLQLFDPSAILLHQTALLSLLPDHRLEDLCAAARVRSLRPRLPGAAAAALFMPWRNSVAGHIQLARLQGCR